MKKQNFLFTVVLAIAVMFSSCKKIENTDLVLDDFNTATVTVYVNGMFDLKEGKYEPVPDGTKVALHTSSGFFGNKQVATDIFDMCQIVETKDGKVVATVKTPKAGATYYIQVMPFAAEVTNTSDKEPTHSFGHEAYDGGAEVFLNPNGTVFKKFNLDPGEELISDL